MFHISTMPIATTCDYRHFKKEESHITRKPRDHVLLFMIEGSLHFTEDGEEVTLEAGEWYWQRAHRLQSANRPSSEPRYFYIHFTCDLQEGESTLFAIKPRGHYNYISYQQDFDALLSHKWRTGISSIAFQMDFLQIMKKLLMENRVYEKENMQIVDKVTILIEEHYTRRHVKNLLEEQIGLSYNYLYKLYKSHKNQSPIQYMQAIRLRKAKELLGHTDMTVEAIALEVGYNELSVFFKAFKKETGIAPHTFRKASRRLH